jgi:hypothetical protein
MTDMKITDSKEIEKAITIGRHTVLKPAKVNIKTTDGSIVHGSINLGFESRVSDVFIGSQNPFIVLFDAATSKDTSGRVLILNKNHIVWVEPEDETPPSLL